MMRIGNLITIAIVVLYINSDFYEYNKSECTIYEP